MGKPDNPRRHDDPGAPIDHAEIIDGFGEMASRTRYESYETRCGLCGTSFLFSAAAQKYVHELRKVPIKSSAKYCPACVDAVAKRNRQRKANSELYPAVQRSTLAAREHPRDPRLLLDSVVARTQLAEGLAGATSLLRLRADLNRLRKLAPDLDVSEWETRVGRLLETDG